MRTADFYYDLPQELIAQDPLEDRSSSRLLVLHRKSGRVEHRVFTDIVEYQPRGKLKMVILLMLRNRKFFQGTVMLIFIRKHTQELLLIDLYSMKLSDRCRKMICL